MTGFSMSAPLFHNIISALQKIKSPPGGDFIYMPKRRSAFNVVC
ncbi:hypothetical protein ACFPFV_05430 [Salinicoccus siamensis]